MSPIGGLDKSSPYKYDTVSEEEGRVGGPGPSVPPQGERAAKISEMDIRSWKAKSKQLRGGVYAFYLASKHPKTPWYAKAFAVLIIGYVLSPIDFIPDFIPVIGYLDDFIIVFAGFSLLIKMIPKEILEECGEKARSQPVDQKRTNWAAAAIIVLI